MKQSIRSLNEIWFDMFANETYANLQEDKNVWAIGEGIHRLNQQRYEWQMVKAQKEHECIRGHKINAWDYYCKRNVGAGWGSDWKFCLGCAAMLFYFLKVEEMPPYGSTHWNYEEKKPVRVNEKK